MTHPAHISRGRVPGAVSPRTEIMKMNNIADYVLGASPKNGLAGIENSIGRMNIGPLPPLMTGQDDVNKNLTEKTDPPKVSSAQFWSNQIIQLNVSAARGEW